MTEIKPFLILMAFGFGVFISQHFTNIQSFYVVTILVIIASLVLIKRDYREYKKKLEELE